jgi:hypothetical protein
MLQGRSATRKGLQSLFLQTNKHKAMIELIILQLLFISQVIKIQHNFTPCYAQTHANPAWPVCRPRNLLEYHVWYVELAIYNLIESTGPQEQGGTTSTCN